MKVTIVGAGSVGRSIARELLGHGHEVMLIDRSPQAMKIASVAEADWLLADACEVDTLKDAGLENTDVVVAATGDDKANLVVSLLAKTEFAVPKVVARVNNPRNEWLFDPSWGVDVSVSTPRIMTSLVEEAVAVGDMVRLFTFQQTGASIYEITLPTTSPVIGRRVGQVELPGSAVLLAILRGDRPITPIPDDTFEAGDELLLILDSAVAQTKQLIEELFAPAAT